MFNARAVLLGAQANELAESGQHYHAIRLYSEAIDTNAGDYRFYLNRAFCYEMSELYHLALADSREAIRLAPGLLLCHLRKARAQTGLRQYFDAEHSYRQCLQIDPHCMESRDEMRALRVRALAAMGFDKQSAMRAAIGYESIREAIDGLLSATSAVDHHTSDDTRDDNRQNHNNRDNSFCNINELDRNLMSIIGQSFSEASDENECISSDDSAVNNRCAQTGSRYADKAREWAQRDASTPPPPPPSSTSSSNPPVPNKEAPARRSRPTNIWGYNGLRVTNVNVDNKRALLKLFSQFGRVLKVKPQSKSGHSVWIYYDNPKAPVEAIHRLQDTEHPDVSHCVDGEAQPLRIYFAATDRQPELMYSRPKQPTKGEDECYYWRTTVCLLGHRCQYAHIGANKQIDAQVWMRNGKMSGGGDKCLKGV